MVKTLIVPIALDNRKFIRHQYQCWAKYDIKERSWFPYYFLAFLTQHLSGPILGGDEKWGGRKAAMRSITRLYKIAYKDDNQRDTPRDVIYLGIRCQISESVIGESKEMHPSHSV